LIGIYTGLRLGDCCKLDWSQINIAQGVIQLMPQKTRRHHGRIVTIPIHPALGQALLGESDELRVKSDELNNGDSISSRYAALGTPYFNGPVLPSISEWYRTSKWRVSGGLGEIFKAAYITTSVKIEGRKHKTPEATFHSLRHTFVSFAANAGVPLHVVQSIVGHESTAMTRHYYHENLAALKSAVAAIPTL
jgi:integrase